MHPSTSNKRALIRLKEAVRAKERTSTRTTKCLKRISGAGKRITVLWNKETLRCKPIWTVWILLNLKKTRDRSLWDKNSLSRKSSNFSRKLRRKSNWNSKEKPSERKSKKRRSSSSSWTFLRFRISWLNSKNCSISSKNQGLYYRSLSRANSETLMTWTFKLMISLKTLLEITLTR